MFKPFKISVNFRALSDIAFGVKVKHIVDTMTLNIALYPLPIPTLASILALWNAYNVLLAKAEHGNEQDTINKENGRKGLEAQLKLLGNNYVVPIAGNDESKLSQSGFDYTGGETNPVTQSPAPIKFEFEPTTVEETVIISQSTQAGTKVYMWQYIEVPADGSIPPNTAFWKYLFTTKGKITITGLTSNQAYFFRGASFAIEAPIQWCAPKKHTPQ
ncbi:MAG: hypothetical protein NTX03_07410 [Bacteroidetes bacterium]|nr:hypothetical protein [Bacteroidota bacterium]